MNGLVVMLSPELRWALGAVLGSLGLLLFARGGAPSTGSTYHVALTVVPSDSADLDCADASIGGQRCGFSAGRRDPSVQRPLRPFVTTGGELMILSGVFESPSIVEWVTASRRARSNERVTLECEVRALGTVSKVGVRFRDGAPFTVQSDVRSGSAESCNVRSSR